MTRHIKCPTVLARHAVVALLVATAAAVVRTEAPPRAFLWKVTGPKTAVYLAGSVHMLTKDFYPLNPALDSAFKDSDLLVEEVDLGEMLSADSQFLMLTRGMLPADQSLDTVASPATVRLVKQHAASLGLPPEPLMRFKPWALSLTLLALEWQTAGFDANLGLDKHFYDRAQDEGKAVEGLETTEYQISRFDGMSMAQQDELLATTLRGLDDEKANVSRLALAWKTGDAPAIERLVLQDLKDDPLMYQRLLVERNKNWLPKLELLLGRSGRAFVVVGAAHLVGPDGLLSMLKAKGYGVQQM
jgi:uncharacterized protein